jgi:nucleoside-diphosphate-sugar epimerase
MPTAIVTGCAGFIGSHLIDELLKKNWTVIGIDNFHPYYNRKLKELNLQNALKNKNFNFIEGSILVSEDLEKLPKNIDFLFHFAAIAGVRNSILHPKEYFEINLEGTKKLLERFQHIGKIIFASTSSVYGDVPNTHFPVKETEPLQPISPYGESKKLAEEFCQHFSLITKTKLSILRFYTVFGPRQRPDEAFTKFIKLILDNKSIPIYGNGNKERDFTYVGDIISGTLLAAEKGAGIYNLGTNNPISVNFMVSVIEKLMRQKVIKKNINSPEGDVEKTHADITKAQIELNYSPKISFETGINNCIIWCKETHPFF